MATEKMNMEDIFEKLKSLQDVLSEKYGIEAQIEDAPKNLSTQEELLERHKKEYIELNTRYEETRAKAAKLRVDLAEAEASREKGEKGMDSITTHREYEILQKEIDDATMMEQTVRKELQKEEKNITSLDEELKAKENLINDSEADLNSKKQELSEEIDSLKAKLEELNAQKADLEPGIDPDIIFKFERIIKSKQGKGIVAVKGNVCDGCHMILPAQFANEVRNGEKIVFCPYCSRILFYQDLEEGESEYYQIPETGTLGESDSFDDFDSLDSEDEDGEERSDDDSLKEFDY